MTLGWNAPSILLYWLVVKAAHVRGEVNFGIRCEIKYKQAWWWLNGFDEIMNAPIFSLFQITLNWWCWFPSGAEVTPKYLHVSVVYKFGIVRRMLSFDYWIWVVLVVVLLLMYGIPLSVNSHVIKYHAHWRVQGLRQICALFFSNYLLLFVSCRICFFFWIFFPVVGVLSYVVD